MNELDTSFKSLFSLDDMVLHKIATHLNVSDLVNLGKTCKRFTYLTQYHFEKHYSSIRWIKNRNAKLCASNEIVRYIGKHIRTINLAAWSDYELCKILVTIGTECGHLESLTLHSVRMNGPHQICDHPVVGLMFSKLKVFRLKDCYWTGWRPMEMFHDKNSTLERLSIKDCCTYPESVYKLELKKFQALKELQLVECRKLLSTVELQRCFENNNITTLSLTNVANINLFDPHIIDPLCSSIEHLTIDYHGPFDFNQLLRLTKLKKMRILSKELSDIDELISRLNPEIEELEVSNVAITNSMLVNFNSFQRLRHLRFEKCFNSIPKDFFRILPTILPNLQHLAYTYSAVTDCDILHMFRLLPKLKHLNLFGCNALVTDTYMKIVDILVNDLHRPKLKFIPPQLGSLNGLTTLDRFRSVLC